MSDAETLRLAADLMRERAEEPVAQPERWPQVVALPLADLLEDGATYLDFMAREHPGEPRTEYGQYFLAVANAYLGEAP